MSPVLSFRLLVVTLLSVALTFGTPVGRPADARASGLAWGTAIVHEQAVVSLTGGHEEILLALTLGPGKGATPTGNDRPAVLFPVPATPTVLALDADQQGLFPQLQQATSPIGTAGSSKKDPATNTTPARSGVSVLSRRTTSGYDVTRLRAGDPDALRSWLRRNGYVTPPRAVPILRDYVARGWAFVAIRLAAQRGQAAIRGTLPSLRIRFPSRRLVYPLRLTAASSQPVSVALYVVGEHRVIAKGFSTHHAGFVSDLRPAPTPAVASLLPGRYLTRLGMTNADPRTITSDVRPRRAVSDRLFRASSDYPYESEEGFATAPLPSALQPAKTDLPGAPGPAAWLLLFPAVAVLIGLGALALRRPWRRR